MKNIIIPKSNIDIAIDQCIDIKNKKILVLSLVCNVFKNSSINYIDKFIRDMRENFNDVKFFFLTNNNKDKTIFLLRQLQRYKYPHTLDFAIHRDERFKQVDRIKYLAKYRNINFIKAIETFGENFDYLIVFDSDLHSDIPVDSISNSLKICKPEWSAITGNHCYKNSSYYYDELALRLENEPIDIKEKSHDFDKFYLKSHEWIKNLYIIKNWIKCKAAFGGISIYKMNEIMEIYRTNNNLYDIDNLPSNTAEHISLNLKLSNNILINPNIKYTNSVSFHFI